MSSLSVIIITKNEEKNIVPCLESVGFADEIIVLDSGSTDQTVQIASKYTQQVYQVDWPGFGVQKNRALDKTNCEWVLSVDADEVVTPELAKEIQAIVHQHTPYVAFEVRRRSTYCGQMVLYGDWGNDYCVRLFKKSNAKFEESLVHEKLIVNGLVGKLKAPMKHHTFLNLEEVLNKINYYSTLSAQQKFSQGKKNGLLAAILHGSWTFFRSYFLKLGFLDGKRGFMLAFSNAEGCYYRYLKIMLLSNPPAHGVTAIPAEDQWE